MNYLDNEQRQRIVAALVEVRIHKSLRCTPEMAAGVNNRLWDIEDIVALLPEPIAKERGPL